MILNRRFPLGLIYLFSPVLLANGLQINEQSVGAAGKAYAGRASEVLDASTIYGNPAGMAKLPGNQIVGGANFIDARSDVSDVSSTVAGSSKGNMVPRPVVVPFGFFTSQLNERWHLGIGVYAPFGGRTDYEGAFQGRYRSSKTSVEVITLQPTLSYRINEQLSIGAGPTFNRIEGLLENRLNNQAVGGRGDGNVKVSGDDTAVGFNAGVLYEPSKNLSLGLVYHSRVQYSLEGATKVTGATGALGAIPALGLTGLNGRYDSTMDLTTPETVDMSITYRLNERLDVSAGALFSRWSTMQLLDVRNSGVPSAYASFSSISEPLNWRDTWSFSTGVAYKLTSRWTLRAGAAYEPTPVPAQYSSTRAPLGDRTIFTFGLGWRVNSAWGMGLAYGHIYERKVKVSQLTSQAGLRPGYSATYQNQANGLGLQVTYQF